MSTATENDIFFAPSEKPGYVNLIALARAAVAASIVASKPIRWIAFSSSSENDSGEKESTLDASSPGPLGNKNARIKMDGTIVTDADGAAQKVIVNMIRNVSHEIRIVGEESREDECRYNNNGNLPWNEAECGDSDEVILEMVKEDIKTRIDSNRSLHTSSEHDYEVEASRVGVLIDPLDGTKHYSKGMYGSVTTLIAIVVDNHPCFGVICKPFGQEGERTLLNSGCFALYGGTLLQGAYVVGGRPITTTSSDLGALSSNCIKPSTRGRKTAVISKSRSGGVVGQCLDVLHSRGFLEKDPVHVSGAGEKALRLIIGTEDESLWFFPRSGTSLWDVAACDALMTPMGGKLTDRHGNRIDYSKSRTDADNVGGIVASNDAELHEECIKIYNEGKWCTENS